MTAWSVYLYVVNIAGVRYEVFLAQLHRWPQAGITGVATVAPMVVGSILANAGISFDAYKIVDTLPRRDTFGYMIIKNTADTIILTKSRIKLSPCVLISCDKGNRKGDKNLAKYLCWYYKGLRSIYRQWWWRNWQKNICSTQKSRCYCANIPRNKLKFAQLVNCAT